MTAPHIAGRADTLVIGLVALAHLLSHFYQVVLGPLFPLLKEEFGVSYTELGLTISVLYGVSGVCQAFVGILVDRYGGYRLMIFGVVTMSTAVLLMGFAPAYWVLLPLAALAALGNSVFHPADLSILSEKVHPSRLGRAFGIHGFGGTCGYFISPIIVYYGVTSVVGWRMGLIVAGLIGLSAALLIWRYRSVLAMPRRDPNFSEERGGKADIGFYRDLVTSAPLMSAFFYFVMVAAALAGMQGFTVTALVERFDTPLHLAAAGVTAYFFGGAVGILLGGEIADRFRYPAFIASGGLAIAAVLMSTIGLFDVDHYNYRDHVQCWFLERNYAAVSGHSRKRGRARAGVGQNVWFRIFGLRPRRRRGTALLRLFDGRRPLQRSFPRDWRALCVGDLYDFAVAPGSARLARRRLVETHIAFNRYDVVRAVEILGRGVAAGSVATDGFEEIFKSGWPDDPELHQVVIRIVEDFVHHVRTQETCGTRYQFVSFAIDEHSPGRRNISATRLGLYANGRGSCYAARRIDTPSKSRRTL